MLYEVNGTEYAVDIVTTPEGEITKVSLLDADCDGIALMPTEAVLEAWEADSLRALVQALVEAMLAKRVPPSLPEGWSWDGNPYDDEGDEVEAVTCLYEEAAGLTARSVLLRRQGEVVLAAGADATYIRNAECLPQDWFPTMMDLNCPPVWEGDDPDTTCRVCRPAALAFPGNFREVLARTVGRVTLDGVDWQAVVGERVQECLQTCCGDTGEREQQPAAVEFVLLRPE